MSVADVVNVYLTFLNRFLPFSKLQQLESAPKSTFIEHLFNLLACLTNTVRPAKNTWNCSELVQRQTRPGRTKSCNFCRFAQGVVAPILAGLHVGHNQRMLLDRMTPNRHNKHQNLNMPCICYHRHTKMHKLRCTSTMHARRRPKYKAIPGQHFHQTPQVHKHTGKLFARAGSVVNALANGSLPD